jgi:hypothetical protein
VTASLIPSTHLPDTELSGCDDYHGNSQHVWLIPRLLEHTGFALPRSLKQAHRILDTYQMADGAVRETAIQKQPLILIRSIKEMIDGQISQLIPSIMLFSSLP